MFTARVLKFVYKTSLNLTEEIYNKPDNDPNINDKNGGTTIYKTELNLENMQEKSRPNSNEFKRLLIGGELGIRTPGCFHINGFQDRRFRPLSQLSILNLMSDFLADLPSILYFWLKIKNLMKKVKKILLFYNKYVNDNKSTHEQIFNRHIFSVYLQMKSKF